MDFLRLISEAAEGFTRIALATAPLPPNFSYNSLIVFIPTINTINVDMST